MQSALKIKKFGLFFRKIECSKPLEAVCKGQQGFPAFTVEVRRSFPWDIWDCWKQNFLKKKHSFKWEKNIRLVFLALSNTKNVSDQYPKVHKVFWQVWCEL